MFWIIAKKYPQVRGVLTDLTLRRQFEVEMNKTSCENEQESCLPREHREGMSSDEKRPIKYDNESRVSSLSLSQTELIRIEDEQSNKAELK
jgi:hypothetical protein